MSMSHALFTFTIRGVVQGVGFRPHVYNACKKAGLVGYVQNIGSGVRVVVDKRKSFENILKKIPETAEIHTVSFTKKQVKTLPKSFSLRKSGGKGFAEIPSDFFVCSACQKELGDPKNRRSQYFFITCTHCGPRFTMTENSPYDRHTTSMQEFPMCEKCQEEYTDPENRRYHAQTIACHDCGPKLSFYQKGKSRALARDKKAIELAVEKIKAGSIVAVKGMGGFHLVCLTKKKSILRLKKLTGRTDKPFAILCQDIAMARSLATISKTEKELLLSKERPIVICKKKHALTEVSELDTIGIMLPYTALHMLLLDAIREPLVCTSSNLSEEPMSKEKDEQFAPFTLNHSRKIVHSADDSLIKVIEDKPFDGFDKLTTGKVQDKPLLIRRSRGFVPKSIEIPHAPKNLSILALGAEMNAGFCLLKDSRVTMSQYLGNTAHPKVLRRYKETLSSFLAFMHAKPDHILCDLHPHYATSKFAEELSQKWHIPLTRVQHHKAHAAGVAFEHNLKKHVAIVCDGLGYGGNGTIWGGEIFVGNKRVGHLELQPQLGGDLATNDPNRMLFGILSKFLSQKEIQKILKKRHSAKELSLWKKQLENKFNTPETSSCGRILDAASALLGFPSIRTYDGRAAMNIEARATRPYPLKPQIQDNILLTTSLFEYLVKNIHRDPARLAATVQRYLAEGLYTIANQYNLPITFSGGCAYNSHMTKYLLSKSVFINKNIPPGDGGISFGQIIYFLRKK